MLHQVEEARIEQSCICFFVVILFHDPLRDGVVCKSTFCPGILSVAHYYMDVLWIPKS